MQLYNAAGRMYTFEIGIGAQYHCSLSRCHLRDVSIARRSLHAHLSTASMSLAELNLICIAFVSCRLVVPHRRTGWMTNLVGTRWSSISPREPPQSQDAPEAGMLCAVSLGSKKRMMVPKTT